jgi:hypothetical protein
MYTMCVLCIGISTLGNSQNEALVEGYKRIAKPPKNVDNEIKDTPEQREITKNNVNNFLFNQSIDTIFFESFNGATLDNVWLENSGTDNMVGVEDPVFGKVLKITSKRPNGNSFLEYDLTKIARGKMLSLKGDIKLENIKRGEQPYEVGQLAIKFQVGEKWVYEAVQNLKGSSDWNTYSAHEDGSTDIDNTDKGSYVFKIPENAENVILYLGLQNCTGTIYFKNIRVLEYK